MRMDSFARCLHHTAQAAAHQHGAMPRQFMSHLSGRFDISYLRIVVRADDGYMDGGTPMPSGSVQGNHSLTSVSLIRHEKRKAHP